jgi:hypothetical protein
MSLFRRAALIDNNDEADTEKSLFSHSHSYAKLVAEEQRRKRRENSQKQRVEQVKKERKVSKKRDSEGDDTGKTSSSPKRRRITLEEGQDLLGSVGLTARDDEYVVDEEVRPASLPLRRSPRKDKFSRGDKRQPDVVKPLVVELEDSEPEEITYDDEPEVVEQDSDDDFAELAKQARARKLREDSAKDSKARCTMSPVDGYNHGNGAISSTPASSDPAAKLLITSPIPNTKPLVVFRKLSQRLQEIRQVWCDRQEFSKDFAAGVFLIYRMRRVFDVTTCRSLGLDVDINGNVVAKGLETIEGAENVHLEAVTDEIFAQMKAEREKDGRVRHGLREPEEAGAETTEAGAPDEPPALEEPVIRILLLSKDRRDPFRIKVKPVWMLVNLQVVYTMLMNRSQRQYRELSAHVVCLSKWKRANLFDSNSTARTWRLISAFKTLRLATWIASMSTFGEA